MSEDNSVDTDPSALEPTDASIYAKQVAPRQRQKPSTAMWLGLGALVILALAVVFVLPSVVTEYKLPLERRVEEVTQSATAVSQVTETAVSPFEEAQRSIQRKQSQDVLAELLELQGQLDLLEVEAWGQEDYEAALSTGKETPRSCEICSVGTKRPGDSSSSSASPGSPMAGSSEIGGAAPSTVSARIASPVASEFSSLCST